MCIELLSFQSNMSVLRLPTSPIKVGILQPSNKANLSLKSNQILPDSTDENKAQELFKKHHHRYEISERSEHRLSKNYLIFFQREENANSLSITKKRS